MASAIMLGVLLALGPLLAAMLAPDQPTLRRAMALLALCGGGLATYAAAGWLLGAFGNRTNEEHQNSRLILDDRPYRFVHRRRHGAESVCTSSATRLPRSAVSSQKCARLLVASIHESRRRW